MLHYELGFKGKMPPMWVCICAFASLKQAESAVEEQCWSPQSQSKRNRWQYRTQDHFGQWESQTTCSSCQSTRSAAGTTSHQELGYLSTRAVLRSHTGAKPKAGVAVGISSTFDTKAPTISGQAVIISHSPGREAACWPTKQSYFERKTGSRIKGETRRVCCQDCRDPGSPSTIPKTTNHHYHGWQGSRRDFPTPGTCCFLFRHP